MITLRNLHGRKDTWWIIGWAVAQWNGYDALWHVAAGVTNWSLLDKFINRHFSRYSIGLKTTIFAPQAGWDTSALTSSFCTAWLIVGFGDIWAVTRKNISVPSWSFIRNAGRFLLVYTVSRPKHSIIYATTLSSCQLSHGNVDICRILIGLITILKYAFRS